MAPGSRAKNHLEGGITTPTHIYTTWGFGRMTSNTEKESLCFREGNSLETGFRTKGKGLEN